VWRRINLSRFDLDSRPVRIHGLSALKEWPRSAGFPTIGFPNGAQRSGGRLSSATNQGRRRDRGDQCRAKEAPSLSSHHESLFLHSGIWNFIETLVG
jgi:hypothetical protein